MAGRGRGKTGSLTQEQLQSLGCVGKDMPQVQTAPPPTYPPLMSKPITIEVVKLVHREPRFNLNLILYFRQQQLKATKYCGKKISLIICGTLLTFCRRRKKVK